MGAAMRLRRAMFETQGSNASGAARCSHCAVAPLRVLYKVGVLAALIVALRGAAAMSGLFTHVHGLHADREPEASQDCSARYAALLDLAELARRDGKSSGIVVLGLSDMHGAMNECLPISRSGHASR
jgi:hypothetical protein